ncbi:hypothetical protein ACEPAH_4030 [Sanghuangporus vaninii]
MASLVASALKIDNFLRRSILTFGSQFTVHVWEHCSFRRTINIMTISVSVSELSMKPFFDASDSDANPISLKIHSGSVRGPFIEVIRRLVEQSQIQLETMKVFLEKFGKTREALDYIVMITWTVSSVHPAAEAAASMATMLLEECHASASASASELMGDVSTFLPFIDIPERGLKFKVIVQTTEEMLVLFQSICKAIFKYSNIFRTWRKSSTFTFQRSFSIAACTGWI